MEFTREEEQRREQQANLEEAALDVLRVHARWAALGEARGARTAWDLAWKLLHDLTRELTWLDTSVELGPVTMARVKLALRALEYRGLVLRTMARSGARVFYRAATICANCGHGQHLHPSPHLCSIEGCTCGEFVLVTTVARR